MPHDLTPTWKDSERFVPRAFVQPVLRFMRIEAAAGIVMLAAAAAALVWANSPWWESYERLWETEVTVHLGDLVHIDMVLRDWVNAGAMSLFFLLVGLEIKRELITGELRNPKAASLPAVAAIGGMVVPALVYLALNAGQPGQDGWAIPVATDIAFAVGVVTLAGKRLPLGARIFILTLAVVDDIGGILVIAFFYSEELSVGWLAVAAVCIAATILIKHSDVRSFVPYVMIGAVCWVAFHEAGIEPAIVGVVMGLITPTRPFHDPRTFAPVARRLVDDVDRRYTDQILTEDELDRDEHDFEELGRLAAETISPLERLEHALGLWVSLGIVPLFAFANAGVHIEVGGIDMRVFTGIVLGLVVGKTIGVFAFAWLGAKLGLGTLPRGTSWSNVFGLAVTAGIGFTVALFITSLSFDAPDLTASAKLGVLSGSVIAGVLGLVALRLSRPAKPPAPEPPGRNEVAWTPSGSSATS